MNSKRLIVGALALAASLGTGLAQARGGDVQWSVTIGAPFGLPVYAQPYPVYTQPYPVYRQPVPVYTQPYPVYTQPAPYVGHTYYPRGQYQRPTRWDRDGDGIPNRRDPVYNPRWDRDGDGIPNRYERRGDWHDDRRGDRDGDGIPNWQDHHDARPGGR